MFGESRAAFDAAGARLDRLEAREPRVFTLRVAPGGFVRVEDTRHEGGEGVRGVELLLVAGAKHDRETAVAQEPTASDLPRLPKDTSDLAG